MSPSLALSFRDYVDSEAESSPFPIGPAHTWDLVNVYQMIE